MHSWGKMLLKSLQEYIHYVNHFDFTFNLPLNYILNKTKPQTGKKFLLSLFLKLKQEVNLTLGVTLTQNKPKYV